MAGVAGALKVKALAKEAQRAAQGLAGGMKADSLAGLGSTRIQATIGSQKSQSNSSSYTEVNQASSITTNNLALIATGAGVDSNINVNGSNLNVTSNALFQADNDFNLNGVAQNSNTRSTNSSSSTAIGGYAATSSSGKASGGITASASRAKGYANSDSVTYANTQVNIGGTTTFDIGNDVNGKGVVFNTDKVQGIIRGNVNMESPQDTYTYDSNQKSAGFNLDVDLLNNGAGSSLSVNGAKTNITANSKMVAQQTGLFANEADVIVEGKGNFKGAVFTTSDEAQANGKSNIVFKQGVTSTDVINTTSYEGDAFSAGLSIGKTNNKPQAAMNGLGYGTDDDSNSSITKGGVSGYNDPQGILTTDNREALAGKLENVFDERRVNEELGAQTQITKEFGKEAPKAVGDFANNRMKAIRADTTLSDTEKLAAIKKWDEGGVYRVAAHTALGALGTGSVEGALTTGGVAAAAPTLNSLQDKMAESLIASGMSESIAKGTASGVVSLALLGAGSAAGLDTSSTVNATNVDANNRQLHPKEQDLAYILLKKAKEKGWKRADGKPYTLEEIEDALRWANSSKYNENYMSNTSALITSKDTKTSTNNKLYDSAAGSSYEKRLWNTYPQSDGSVRMTQNLQNIDKPDNNLITFIKGEAPSYGYTWDRGINQPYNAKTAGPTSKPKPTTTAQIIPQKSLDNRNQAIINNNGSIDSGSLPAAQQQANQKTFDNIVTVVDVVGLATGAGEVVIAVKWAGKKATQYIVKKSVLNEAKQGTTSVDDLIKVSRPVITPLNNNQRGAVGNLNKPRVSEPQPTVIKDSNGSYRNEQGQFAENPNKVPNDAKYNWIDEQRNPDSNVQSSFNTQSKSLSNNQYYRTETEWQAPGRGTGLNYKVYQQDIDLNAKPRSNLGDMRTNADLMKQGGSPYVLKNGQYEQVQLHHSRQDGRGTLFETSESTHLNLTNQTGRQAVHPYSPQSHPDYPVNRDIFDKDKSQYWKDRLNQLQGK